MAWATELAELLTCVPTSNGAPSILSPPVLTGLLGQLDGLSASAGVHGEALQRECTGTVHHIKQWLLSKADKAARLGVGDRSRVPPEPAGEVENAKPTKGKGKKKGGLKKGFFAKR